MNRKTSAKISSSLKGRLVVFHGYDDKMYTAFVVKVRNGVARLTYNVPGLNGTITAHISDSTRIMLPQSR